MNSERGLNFYMFLYTLIMNTKGMGSDVLFCPQGVHHLKNKKEREKMNGRKL